MGVSDRDYYQDNVKDVRPWDTMSAVTLLIIANIIPFVLDFVLANGSGRFTDYLALRPGTLAEPLQWYRLLSYAFAHADIYHILFNMLALFFLGRSVEQKYGKAEFFRIYLVTAFACGLIWALLRLAAGINSGPGVVGASGATTAIVMLFVFNFPQVSLMIYGIIPVKAWIVGIVIVVMNLLGVGSGPNTAYDVHLFGIGFAAAYFYLGWNLGNLTSFFQLPSFKTNRLKVHRPSKDEDDLDADQKEADRILEKIHREGAKSLTRREQTFLENYSKAVRERRN